MMKSDVLRAWIKGIEELPMDSENTQAVEAATAAARREQPVSPDQDDFYETSFMIFLCDSL